MGKHNVGPADIINICLSVERAYFVDSLITEYCVYESHLATIIFLTFKVTVGLTAVFDFDSYNFIICDHCLHSIRLADIAGQIF